MYPTDITELFISLIEEHREIDVAESEFKRMMYDDNAIRTSYRSWCESEGYTERRGFIEFCKAYIDDSESRWDVLNQEYE